LGVLPLRTGAVLYCRVIAFVSDAIAWAVGRFSLFGRKDVMKTGRKRQEALEAKVFWVFSVIGGLATVVWCFLLGGWTTERTSLALAACSAAFAFGSLLGFIFTIFGEELEPLGKIRDAMIALASGIAGISVAKVNDIGAMIGSIQLFNDRSAKGSWFSVLFMSTYFVAGFYFMYLMRKLALNPALARSRVAIERIQISGSVSVVAMELGKKLPQSVLLGREFIEDLVEDGGKQAEQLRSVLFGDDVERFLAICERDLEAGSQMQLDTVGKAAILHYYRIYFKEEADRGPQEERAIEWITRTLLMDPLDRLFQIKLADVFGMQEGYGEAVSIFERLERDEDAPQYVQQWLGYFLLFIEGREGDSIKHSLEFHRRFPDESDGLFNAACGYAQLYAIELRDHGVKEIQTSENRMRSLSFLEEAVRLDPGSRSIALKVSEPGDSFESLASDVDFLQIVGDARVPGGTKNANGSS
jgi:hypothetical protein